MCEPSVRDRKGSDSLIWGVAHPLTQLQSTQPSRPPQTEQFLVSGEPTSGKPASKRGNPAAASPRSPKNSSSPIPPPDTDAASAARAGANIIGIGRERTGRGGGGNGVEGGRGEGGVL